MQERVCEIGQLCVRFPCGSSRAGHVTRSEPHVCVVKLALLAWGLEALRDTRRSRGYCAWFWALRVLLCEPHIRWWLPHFAMCRLDGQDGG